MPPANHNHEASGGSENESHPLDWLERTGASGALLHELDSRRKRRRGQHRIGAVVGVVAVAISVSAIWFQSDREQAPMGLPSSATIVSVPERRALADGSVAE